MLRNYVLSSVVGAVVGCAVLLALRPASDIDARRDVEQLRNEIEWIRTTPRNPGSGETRIVVVDCSRPTQPIVHEETRVATDDDDEEFRQKPLSELRSRHP